MECWGKGAINQVNYRTDGPINKFLPSNQSKDAHSRLDIMDIIPFCLFHIWK